MYSTIVFLEVKENVHREPGERRLIRFYVNFISRFSNVLFFFLFDYKLFDKKEKIQMHIFNVSFTIYAEERTIVPMPIRLQGTLDRITLGAVAKGCEMKMPKGKGNVKLC